MTAREKQVRERCEEFVRDKYKLPPDEAPIIIAELEAFAREIRNEALEEAAVKLEAAAEHHANADKHPAWDRSRVDCEPCEEHGHVYHSYPGYAAHVVAQMAGVTRAMKTSS